MRGIPFLVGVLAACFLLAVGLGGLLTLAFPHGTPISVVLAGGASETASSSDVGSLITPPLPKGKWEKHDLSMFLGCWKLGKEYETSYGPRHGQPDGREIVHAQRLCFDEHGIGTLASSGTPISGPALGKIFECEVRLTAEFSGSEALVARHQDSTHCIGNTLYENAYTCRRQDDHWALCDGIYTGQSGLLFRREGDVLTER